MSLKGRTAVITGSNSGIGLGVAEELAKAGADVVLNSFTDTKEDHALAERIAGEQGVGARYIQADMADPDACRNLIEQAGVVVSWSTTPASSTSPRSTNSRARSGTRSSRSCCLRRSTPRPRHCRECASAAGVASSTSLRPTG